MLVEVQGNAHTKLKWKLYKNTNVRGREGPVLPGVSDLSLSSGAPRKGRDFDSHKRWGWDWQAARYDVLL